MYSFVVFLQRSLVLSAVACIISLAALVTYNLTPVTMRRTEIVSQSQPASVLGQEYSFQNFPRILQNQKPLLYEAVNQSDILVKQGDTHFIVQPQQPNQKTNTSVFVKITNPNPVPVQIEVSSQVANSVSTDVLVDLVKHDNKSKNKDDLELIQIYTPAKQSLPPAVVVIPAENTLQLVGKITQLKPIYFPFTVSYYLRPV